MSQTQSVDELTPASFDTFVRADALVVDLRRLPTPVFALVALATAVLLPALSVALRGRGLPALPVVYALLGLAVVGGACALPHVLRVVFLDREQLAMTEEGVELTLGLVFRLRRAAAPWSEVDVSVYVADSVSPADEPVALSPWQRPGRGGVVLEWSDSAYRVGEWLTRAESEQLAALIESRRHLETCDPTPLIE